MAEKVKPITLRDTETKDVYTLEFNRETVKFAEGRGFRIEDLSSFPMTKIPEFVWYAFRMHHKRVSLEQAERFIEQMGGIPDGFLERLAQLYSAPFEALTANETEDGEEKNVTMTVEF